MPSGSPGVPTRYSCGLIPRVLGREPKDFADFAREAARDGAWHG
ncbi:hypothetical protein [Streptomyces rubiginosohelvolus]